MPSRTLSIGGATFDLFVRTDPSVIQETKGARAFTLPLGEKMRIDDVTGTFGGGAANTAVGLARLGCTAGFCGPIGTDQWGEAIRCNLQEAGVNLTQATFVEGEASSFSLILSAENGERTILTHKGIDRHLSDPTLDLEGALNADGIYVTSIHDDSREITDDIAELLLALPDIHLTWNPGGSQITAGMTEKNATLLLPTVDLLLLNKEEVLTFTGRTDVLDALKALLQAGVHHIAVTDGAQGVTATDGTRLIRCPSLRNPVLDTTGAGDAFGTGTTWSILQGKDLPEALIAGTINAASVVGSIGAQAGLLTETQIRQRLAKTDLSVSVESF